MGRKYLLILILFTSNITLSLAQLGGRYTYQFLEIPVSARIAALGGNQMPIYDKDIALALHNPSLLNPMMSNMVSLCYTDYPSDIKFGNAAWAKTLKNGYNGLAAIRYMNYGKFNTADEYGNVLGTFTAGEYALSVSASREIRPRIIAGTSLRLVYSSFDEYYSIGLSTDYGISYHDTSALIAASLVINNVGTQLKAYSPGNYEPLPLDIQLGFSKKFAHMPLRFILIAHHLNIPDFTYYDPAKDKTNIFDNSAQQINQQPFTEKVFRHMIVGGELVITKNFFVRFGYNHQRRKEMLFEGRGGFTGFSWGFGMRISHFHISYGNVGYHIAGASNYFSITTKLSDLFGKIQ